MNIKKLALRMFPGLYARLRGQKAYLDYYRRKHTRPDQIPKILEKRYYEITGHRMDMQHPRTYSEKLQWLKLYDPSPDRSRLADKVAVRDWVREQIGEEYLIPVSTYTGLQIMSINLILENETEPVVWRGPVIAGAVTQFWTDVLWRFRAALQRHSAENPDRALSGGQERRAAGL